MRHEGVCELSERVLFISRLKSAILRLERSLGRKNASRRFIGYTRLALIKAKKEDERDARMNGRVEGLNGHVPRRQRVTFLNRTESRSNYHILTEWAPRRSMEC